MTGVDLVPPSRLLLALGAARTGDGTHALIAHLAHRASLHVSVLFVEDEALHAAAALPFARIVGAATGESRSLAPAEMARSLAAAARRVESELLALARVHRFACSFEARRGHFGSELLRRAGDAAAVMVPPRRMLAGAASPPRSPPRIFVGPDPATPGGARALAFAGMLAEARPDARLRMLPPDAPADDLRTAGAGDVLVVPVPADAEAIDAVLAGLRCPAVLVA